MYERERGFIGSFLIIIIFLVILTIISCWKIYIWFLFFCSHYWLLLFSQSSSTRCARTVLPKVWEHRDLLQKKRKRIKGLINYSEGTSGMNYHYMYVHCRFEMLSVSQHRRLFAKVPLVQLVFISLAHEYAWAIECFEVLCLCTPLINSCDYGEKNNAPWWRGQNGPILIINQFFLLRLFWFSFFFFEILLTLSFKQHGLKRQLIKASWSRKSRGFN